jgi:hypothetical protein
VAVFMVSPHFYDHPNTIFASDAAIGLWVRAGSWMADTVSIGFVPYDLVNRWESQSQAAELVRAGLWRNVPGGWQVLEAVPAAPGAPPLRLWAIRRDEWRPHIPDGIRSAVMERDGYQCLECGATDDLTLDHIYPWSLGGPDTLENLRVLCRSCNCRKGARI